MLYDILIYAVCISGWIIVLWPAFFYLIAKSGWEQRRHRILTSFKGDALKNYFTLYFPSVDIRGEDHAKLTARFKDHYTFYYGRKLIAFPLIFLALVAGLGMWGTAETLMTWQTQHGHFAWPPIILSAFLGAFTWVASDQLSRLRRRDLGPGDVYNCGFRFLIAAPFGVALAAVTKDAVGIPLAFLIGVFPTTTLFTIGRRIASKALSVEDNAAGQSELETLPNIGKVNAEHFADEGVTTIAELAWTDPVDLAVRTNFDFNYVTDCMSEALLAVYVGTDIRKLALFSLRGAMEAGGLIEDMGEDIEEPNPTAAQRDARKALTEAAAVLKIDPQALRYTLSCVAEDPYTQFIWRHCWSQ